MSENDNQPANGVDHSSQRGRTAVGTHAPLMRFRSTLFAHGHARARQSGALEPRQDDLGALAEHAVAMARDAHRPAYAPNDNPNDHLHESRFQWNLERRRVLVEIEENAEKALRDAEAKRAAIPPSDAAGPALPTLMLGAAIFVLALTVTTTLRDFLFHEIENEEIAWGISLIMSLGFGIFLSHSALGEQQADGEASTRGKAVIVGGVIIVLAMGLWRLSGATRREDYFTVLALTGLEIGVIVILDWTGRRHEAATRRWRARRDARSIAEAAVTAASCDLERHRTDLSEIDDALQAHVEYVEDRTLRNLAIEELVKASTTAVLDGYNSGIAENRGHVRGRRP
jgi:hypothetical protein